MDIADPDAPHIVTITHDPGPTGHKLVIYGRSLRAFCFVVHHLLLGRLALLERSGEGIEEIGVTLTLARVAALG